MSKSFPEFFALLLRAFALVVLFLSAGLSISYADGSNRAMLHRPIYSPVRAVDISLRLDPNEIAELASASGKPEAFEIWLEQMKVGTDIILSNVFKLKSVELRGNYRLNESEVLASTEYLGQPFLWKLLGYNTRESLGKNPWIEDVKVTWSVFPTRVVLAIKEAEPWLVAAYRKNTWLISRSGRLLQPLDSLRDGDLVVDSSELPRLDGLDEPSSSHISDLSEVNQRLISALGIIKLFDLAGGYPFEVERFTYLEGGGLELSPVEIDKYPQLLVSKQSFQGAKKLLERAEAVFADLKDKGLVASVVDLRFRDQAIVR
ncbi:hypothetical protein BVY02_01915 [bacterium J17]|nr:hypothetical protein BVY02_01915 [bacterium J17]